MSTLKLSDTVIHTYGELPDIGETCPEFRLTQTNLETVDLSDWSGKNVILNIYPCLDTQVCFESVYKMSEIAADCPDTIIACISVDLPFTLDRIQKAEAPKLDNILLLSDYKNREFGEEMGLIIADGPIGGLLARAVIVLDKDHTIIYTDQSEDVAKSIDYSKLKAFVHQHFT